MVLFEAALNSYGTYLTWVNLLLIDEKGHLDDFLQYCVVAKIV